MTKTNKKPSCR